MITDKNTNMASNNLLERLNAKAKLKQEEKIKALQKQKNHLQEEDSSMSTDNYTSGKLSHIGDLQEGKIYEAEQLSKENSAAANDRLKVRQDLLQTENVNRNDQHSLSHSAITRKEKDGLQKKEKRKKRKKYKNGKALENKMTTPVSLSIYVHFVISF